MYTDTSPKLGDSDNILWGKICEVLNARESGNLPPMPGDSTYVLMFKVARLLNGE